ncbi:polyadenylate-binding protein-interacting protein 1 isoform X1 [Drosophila sulfurigaster albostrigata]|uniref:polyadenylate-binding protein-interacting protein 1 isoform X1 n=2 Tax=Drosophila sulfurigaster albostrigata TaxID=89887 RepID=UPI002D21A3F8|nr:polyadenylate-binding protein-interacting protein 1 isoform X1 [Drosophila sulfurigaster albostrigata]
MSAATLDKLATTLDVTETEQKFFESADAAAATAMSCRAPFEPEDQYKQLRRPNPGAGSAPQMSAAMQPLDQPAFHDFVNVGYGPTGGPYAAGPALNYAATSQPPNDMQNRYTNMPSKLSVTANVFVPNTMDKRVPAQQQQQYQNQPYAQQPHQQRYMNGYKQQHQHQHQQQNYNHHQQNQSFNNEIQQLSNSVNTRLYFGKQPPHNGAVGNYYQQPQQQQQQVQTLQHQQHTQQPQSTFQRHTHLNNSFQQIAQQPQQPPYYHHHQQQQQQQQQPQASTSSAAASSSSAASHPDMETIALEYLDTVIHCLNQNPGQFDTIASRFLTIFDGMESNNYVLSIAMEDIFEKSIEQPNFRYMGAKLYNLLHMLNLKQDSLFHTLLKCKLEYHQAEVTKYMQSVEQQQKVRETALFLAELYMQLRGDDDARIQLIAVNIVYSLRKLLACESAENVRCICQTLKLAGYDLSADCQQDMHVIIASLQAIEAKSPGKYAMAANVIALQQNNWGRKVLNALGGEDGDAAKPPEPPRLSDEPVFYGPDGRELTAEESDFLAAEDENNGSDGDDFDVRDNELDLDPEMDEETERAYKDFCKQGKQSQANKKS